MPKHEYFHELCATASLGEASAAELAELSEHIHSCEECQRRYLDFREIHASQYANQKDHELSESEAAGCIDSPLLRQRFFERAQSEGIVFSQKPALIELRTSKSIFRPKRWTAFLAPISVAAALVVASALATFYIVKQRVTDHTPSISAVVSFKTQQSLGGITQLEGQNSKLAVELSAARANALRLSNKIAELQQESAGRREEVQHIGGDLKKHQQEEADLAEQLRSARNALDDLQLQVAQARSSAIQSENALIEAKVRVNDLTQQLNDQSKALEREKELFAAGRDIRQLMAARNLHIVDVFDTDAKGKTQPAFGRIFLTEGKSLLFYAYDLNDKRAQDAGYKYRVWGKREGLSQRAKSLGIFYSDDKSQKRWVFQYDDPKVLQEIDSVFVTLEPPNGNGVDPKGQKLMYAYLRGQANHP